MLEEMRDEMREREVGREMLHGKTGRKGEGEGGGRGKVRERA